MSYTTYRILGARIPKMACQVIAIDPVAPMQVMEKRSTDGRRGQYSRSSGKDRRGDLT